jgi:hypothetical protein
MPDDARETEQLSKTVRGQSPSEPDTLCAGDALLDRFKLVRLVGRGEMGDVYEAQDLRLHVTVLGHPRAPAASLEAAPPRLGHLPTPARLLMSAVRAPRLPQPDDGPGIALPSGR